MAYLVCFRSGHLEIRDSRPDGSLPIADGTREEMELIQQRGRLAYEGKTWLVPGVPEAADDNAAFAAFEAFKKWANAPAGSRQEPVQWPW